MAAELMELSANAAQMDQISEGSEKLERGELHLKTDIKLEVSR